jgi:hypothetical protein
MAESQTAVREFSMGNTPEIAIPLAKPNADIWRTRTFRLNNAHAKLLAIVLAHHKPIDLLTGQSIDIAKALAWINAKEFHHFFPRKYLERRGEPQQKINCLANFVMLTSASNKTISDEAPSDYLAAVTAAAGSDLPRWLESNLIPQEAFDAATHNDLEAFLELRSAHIHNAVLAKAGWLSVETGTQVAPAPDSEDDDSVE